MFNMGHDNDDSISLYELGKAGASFIATWVVILLALFGLVRFVRWAWLF